LWPNFIDKFWGFGLGENEFISSQKVSSAERQRLSSVLQVVLASTKSGLQLMRQFLLPYLVRKSRRPILGDGALVRTLAKKFQVE
jgi:hypothetical protein